MRKTTNIYLISASLLIISIHIINLLTYCLLWNEIRRPNKFDLWLVILISAHGILHVSYFVSLDGFTLIITLLGRSIIWIISLLLHIWITSVIIIFVNQVWSAFMTTSLLFWIETLLVDLLLLSVLQVLLNFDCLINWLLMWYASFACNCNWNLRWWPCIVFPTMLINNLIFASFDCIRQQL